MPIYEYECPKCGVFEATQRITDVPLKRCPECRGKVRKLISSTSFQLKGSGWYVTDYARKGGEVTAKEGKTDKGGEGSAGETSSEKKPDSKPAKKDASKSPAATAA
jgi:putative FmdB family regulatory protein